MRAADVRVPLGRRTWLLPLGLALVTGGNGLIGLGPRLATFTTVAGLAFASWFLVAWRHAGRPAKVEVPGWLLVSLLAGGVSLLIGLAAPGRWSAGIGAMVFVAAVVAALTANPVFPAPLSLMVGAWVLAASAWAVEIVTQPAPRIDVFYFIGQAARGLWAGANPYAGLPVYPENLLTPQLLGSDEVWFHPYPYPPGSVLLLAPFESLLGDFRWGLLLACLLVVPVARSLMSPLWSVRVGFFVLVMPGWQNLASFGWTDPILLLLLASTVAAAAAGRGGPAALLAGLMLATKQYALIPLGVLAAWRPFGLRSTVWSLAVAAAIALPFFVGQPGGFLEGTVFAHSELGLRDDSETVAASAAAMGWSLGPIARGALLLVALLLLVRPPHGTAEALLVCGLAMGWVFALSTHAFYNYYWLVAALLTLGMACLAGGLDDPDGCQEGASEACDSASRGEAAH